MMYFPALNRSRCCAHSLCTECYLQARQPIPRPRLDLRFVVRPCSHDIDAAPLWILPPHWLEKHQVFWKRSALLYFGTDSVLCGTRSQVLSSRNGGGEAACCPFCAHSGYSVTFHGPKTAAEREAEALEAADTLERQRRGREARLQLLLLTPVWGTCMTVLCTTAPCRVSAP